MTAKGIEVFGLMTEEATLNIQVPPHLRSIFKELVQRACNLWPEAPNEIKEFADMMTVGTVQQQYALIDVKRTATGTGKRLGSEYTKHQRFLDLCVNCGSGSWSHITAEGSLWCDKQIAADHQLLMQDPVVAESFKQNGYVPPVQPAPTTGD